MTKKLLIALLFLLLALSAAAQAPAPQQKPAEVPGMGAQVREDRAETATVQVDTKISPAEAQILFKSVDEILKFVSQDTGLPIKHPVKRQLASREQVQKYIEDRLKDDKDAQRLQRSEAVLKRFGLVPRDFNLSSFLVQLLREQVAGYYDSKTKTVYLLDWLSADSQKPVLAHELTHALQDQNFGLEKFSRSPRPADKNEAAVDPDGDEQLAARQAAMEGQAMIVLVDYLLAPEGRTVAEFPMLVDAMRAGMGSDNTPVLRRAPLYIKESLLFPYTYGLTFERDLLVKGGKEKAFAGVFNNPPRDTRQIMEPSTYLQGENTPYVPVADFGALAGKDYQRYDVGILGQFDVSVLLRIYASSETSNAITPKWRGGYYYAARKKTPGNSHQSELPAIVYVSRWATPDAASQFAAAYSAGIPKRYSSPVRLGRPEQGSGVAYQNTAQVRVGVADRATGATMWKTDDGFLLIEVRGDTVVAIEGFDQAAAERVRDGVFASGKM